MSEAFIVDYVRTPFGRFAGALATMRADDLAAVPMGALLARHPSVDPALIEEVVYGCANQAGEDNRNVARMAALLAGLPPDVPGVTVNRLCGSSLDAIGIAATSASFNLAGAGNAGNATVTNAGNVIVNDTGVVAGRPASSAAIRATLRLSSPA